MTRPRLRPCRKFCIKKIGWDGGGGTKTRELVRRGCNEESWWWERCGGDKCGIWECGVKEGNCLCVLLDRIH